MTISWNEPVKVAFEFRIVDSRAAVVLWSSSVTAPNAWYTIREAIKHQDDIQMDRRVLSRAQNISQFLTKKKSKECILEAAFECAVEIQ